MDLLIKINIHKVFLIGRFNR